MSDSSESVSRMDGAANATATTANATMSFTIVREQGAEQGAVTWEGAGTEGALAQGRVYDYGGPRLFDTHSWKTAFV